MNNEFDKNGLNEAKDVDKDKPDETEKEVTEEVKENIEENIEVDSSEEQNEAEELKSNDEIDENSETVSEEESEDDNSEKTDIQEDENVEEADEGTLTEEQDDYEEADDVTAAEGIEENTAEEKEDNNSFIRGIFEILEMLAIAVAAVVLIITFFFRFSNVEGESMTYTINEKDTLLVSMAFYKPEKGDVVIFQAPNYDLNKPLVKRVIATEGDSLEINFDTWEVKVNGQVIDEYYVRYHHELPDGEDELYMQNNPSWDMHSQSVGYIEGGEFDPETKIFKATIPEGHVFTMGDNRNNSHDSRSADVGMVDERCIIGKVICRLLPFEDFGTID